MKCVTVLVLCAMMVFCVQAYNDDKCTDRGGKCQYTSSRCSGGTYVRRLCGGPSNRRCCVPIDAEYNDDKCTDRGGKCQSKSSRCSRGEYFKGFCGGPSSRRCCVPIGSSGCMEKTEKMACELHKSRKVKAAKSHPSGNKDKAYAASNLEDMCNGKKASRSSYRCSRKCHAPGGSTCLSYNLLNYLIKLKNGRGSVQINEIAGACHSCRSKHYSGLAVDLHKNGRQSEYMKECKRNGGWALDEKNHIHCQFSDGDHPNWE